MISKTEREKLIEEFRAKPLNVLDFEIRRNKESQLTFSKEALNTAVELFQIFLGARILSEWDATEIAPSRIDVSIELKFREEN